MQLYAKVRRAVLLEGKSRRETAKYYGISRSTVEKMLKHSLPPGYRRKNAVSSKLDPFKIIVDRILEEDAREKASGTPKQRHTSYRIFERLRDEYGYTGGKTIVGDYVREKKRKSRESFIPLTHKPGRAQVDFGEADIYLRGVKTRCHYFVMDLPYSDMLFMKIYPCERTECFLDAHVEAFKYFGGIPEKILYDNTSIAVKLIYRDTKERELTDAFAGLQSHYLFDYGFCRPGKGHEKGNVEGRIGYTRRNYMVPIPRVSSLLDFNIDLLARIETLKNRQVRGKEGSVGERLVADLKNFFALPPVHYDPCIRDSSTVRSELLVRFDGVDYSVPFGKAYHDVNIKGYHDTVEITLKDGTLLAKHPRSYEKEDVVYNPLHYLELLEMKPGAFEQAAPLQNWELPLCFNRMQNLLNHRLGINGKREYIQILRLLERFSITEVEVALDEALDLGVIGYDAVKSLLLCLIENKPPKLDLTLYPYLPTVEVHKTELSSYAALYSTSKNWEV